MIRTRPKTVEARALFFAERNTKFGKTSTMNGKKIIDVNLFESRGLKFTHRSTARGCIKIEETTKGSKQFMVTKRPYREPHTATKVIAVFSTIVDAKRFVINQVSLLFIKRHESFVNFLNERIGIES